MFVLHVAFAATVVEPVFLMQEPPEGELQTQLLLVLENPSLKLKLSDSFLSAPLVLYKNFLQNQTYYLNEGLGKMYDLAR